MSTIRTCAAFVLCGVLTKPKEDVYNEQKNG
jgi:hypothetical protein